MITIGTKVMCIKSFHNSSFHYIEKNIYTITKIDKMHFQHSETLNYYEVNYGTWFPIEEGYGMFSDYFKPLKELRKQKLLKLNENTNR